MNKLSKEKKEYIENISRTIKKKFKEKFDINEFKNPFEIISNMEEYIIIRFPNKNNIQGFTLKKGQYKCIYINSADTLGRQHYSCWHEFYHSIDDRTKFDEITLSIKGDKSIVELEAEYFASCMLMDKIELEDFIRLNWKNENMLEEKDLIKIQYYFNVSYSALQQKLNEIYNTKRFFTFTINLQKNRNEFEKMVTKMGYNIDLISSTDDFCLPEKFINAFKKNMMDKRIGISKAKEIVELLNEKEVKIKW